MDSSTPNAQSMVDSAAIASLAPPVGGEFNCWLKPNPDAAAFLCLEKRMGTSIRFEGWKFFHIVKGPKKGIEEADLPTQWTTKPDKIQASCNCCGELVAVASKNLKSGKSFGWTNAGIKSHVQSGRHSTTCTILAEKTSKIIDKPSGSGNKKRKSQAGIEGFMGPVAVPVHLRQKNQCAKTTRFIVDNMLPFGIVESESFRDMIKSHNPSAKVMSNIKVKETIINLENKMRNTAIETMKGHSVCFTLDHWTSKAHQNYTGMTGHFIDDDWMFHSMALGMFLHEGKSTAPDLEKAFVDTCLKELKVKVGNIFAGTTDTTANMNSFGQLLEDMGIEHVYCTDHVLQLTCKQCYDSVVETFGPGSVSVTKARAIVTFFNSSTQATEKLKKKQKQIADSDDDSSTSVPLGVVTDVVTRWWSTFAMIERLLKLKAAIDILGAAGDLGQCAIMTPADWDNLLNIMVVLQPFKEAQKLLEGEKYVTSSWVAMAVSLIRKQLGDMSADEQPDTASKHLAASLLTDFDERWGTGGDNGSFFNPTVQRGIANRQVGIHPHLLIATFLDPRFKSLTSVPDLTAKRAIQDRVLELMNQNENGFRQKSAAVAAGGREEEKNDSDSEDEDDIYSAVERTLANDNASGGTLESVGSVCRAEWMRYLG